MVAVLEDGGGKVCENLGNRRARRRCGSTTCEPHAVAGSVKESLEYLIDDDPLLDGPFGDQFVGRLRSEVCTACGNRFELECSCPLQYLLPLGVNAIDVAQYRRQMMAPRLDWPDAQLPETD